ncbi:MAG: hypothetical protein AB7O43_11805 [Hyphomicrobiaceae bacterium]
MSFSYRLPLERNSPTHRSVTVSCSGNCTTVTSSAGEDGPNEAGDLSDPSRRPAGRSRAGYCSFALPLGGLALAVASTLFLTVHRDSAFSVILILLLLAGVLINGLGIGRAVGCAERCKTSVPTLRQFHGLIADMLSVAVLLGALGLCAQLQAATALLAIAAYVVILLCVMIKASALKKSGRAKWLRAGWIARAVVAVTMLEPLLNEFALAALFPLLEMDLLEIGVCAAILLGAVIRSFWAGARLAGRDPPPLPEQALITPPQAYAET